MKLLQYFTSLLFALVSLAGSSQIHENPEDVKPLKVGQPIPDITIRTLDGKPVNLLEVTARKPTVLVFYRGGWCPYCNQHLAELAEIEDQILDAGYQIIAVSPDSPENLMKTLDKNEIKYTLLSDGRGELIKAMGLAYKATFLFENFRSKRATGERLDILPVPSLFIVSRSGTILYEYVNPDYTVRMSGEALLKVLATLNP